MYTWKQKKGKEMNPEISRGTRKLSLISIFLKKNKKGNFAE